MYKLCTVNLLPLHCGFFYTQCHGAEIFSPWFFLGGERGNGYTGLRGRCESQDLQLRLSEWIILGFFFWKWEIRITWLRSQRFLWGAWEFLSPVFPWASWANPENAHICHRSQCSGSMINASCLSNMFASLLRKIPAVVLLVKENNYFWTTLRV